MFFLSPVLAAAAPYAALVMDARSGEVLYATNADTRLHPASLTKMMTLYIAFEAIEHGEISLDTKVTVSAHAAAEPPSKLGLKTGQKIALRYLIRAAAIKSANDAATAIGEAIAGSETEFAKRMNRTARALGMRNTSFRNANGLTRAGHLSTARDMTILGRRLFYDFPQYYNLFSRRSADAGMRQVNSTNRKFLAAYRGADGIKTGYTSAAGFNLTASAERDGKRIIATIFGGSSTAQRNAKMAELLDLGFARAPARVPERRPAPPQYLAANTPSAPARIKASPLPPDPRRVVIAAAAPEVQPAAATLPADAPKSDDLVSDDLAAAVAAAVAESLTAPEVPAARTPAADTTAAASRLALAESPRPVPAPNRAAPAPEPAVAPAVAVAAAEPAVEIAAVTPPAPRAEATAPANVTAAPAAARRNRPENLRLAALTHGTTPATGPKFVQATPVQPETLELLDTRPPAPGQTVILAAVGPEPAPLAQPTEVVARVSSSGGRNWGVSLGKFGSSFAADRALLQTALMENDTLAGALRKVTNRRGGFEANFVGLTKEVATLACARLTARARDCKVIGP
nr:D-alanyl-D-alanine carboxypeptidase family protein [Phaeovulum vinaykumarii]